ncbi:MAG: hypothetical protein IT184_16015 [Acidobacteria bacterium]|nr:hypothetical protein [Acidobacteriota bacterium]
MTSRAARRLAADALGLYVASRAVGLAILLLVEDRLHGARFPGGPPLRLWADAVARWDAVFYRSIAVDGYPVPLPVDGAGAVQPNNWAFFPAFPLLTRGVSAATGVGFEAAAVLLNLTLGAVACVWLAALVRRVADDRAALRAVGLWTCFPTAFVLQVPYSEACYAACAIGCLYALVARRPGLSSALLVGAALSRGYVLPLSAAGVAFVASEWRTRRDVWRSPAILGLALTAVAAPWLWMLIAAIATGRLDAYQATQEAWGLSFDAARALDRWRDAIGALGHDLYFTATVVSLALACVTTVFAWTVSVGMELRAYAVAAALLLVAISQPGAVAIGSVPRFTFGIVSIPIVLAMRTSDRATAGLALLGLALQYFWVLNVWTGRIGVAP